MYLSKLLNVVVWSASGEVIVIVCDNISLIYLSWVVSFKRYLLRLSSTLLVFDLVQVKQAPPSASAWARCHMGAVCLAEYNGFGWVAIDQLPTQHYLRDCFPHYTCIMRDLVVVVVVMMRVVMSVIIWISPRHKSININGNDMYDAYYVLQIWHYLGVFFSQNGGDKST